MNDGNKPKLIDKAHIPYIHDAQLEFAKAVVAEYDIKNHPQILVAALKLLTCHVEDQPL